MLGPFLFLLVFSRQIQYDYDENGNTTAITPPSKPVHQFDYTAVDLQQQYAPPAVTGISAPQTHYAYNLDKQLLQIQRPDGQAIDFVYDAVKKRLNRIEWPNNESISYTYDNSTGQDAHYNLLKKLLIGSHKNFSPIENLRGKNPLTSNFSKGKIKIKIFGEIY